MALITETQALRMIPDLASGAETTLITELIDQAGHLIAAYLGFPSANGTSAATCESTTYTRFLTGDGTRDLDLGVGPVSSVTSIYDDPTLDYTSATYLVSSGDYAVLGDSRKRIVRLTSTATHGTWSTTPGAIKVVFVAGFSSTPEPLVRAAQLTVRHHFDLRKRLGVASDSFNGSSATYNDPDALPAEVKRILSGSGFVLPRRFL